LLPIVHGLYLKLRISKTRETVKMDADRVDFGQKRSELGANVNDEDSLELRPLSSANKGKARLSNSPVKDNDSYYY